MKEYEDCTIENATAIALCDEEDESRRQDVLLVSSTTEWGEGVDQLVFGWQMPETYEDWRDMCEDSGAWEHLYEEHHMRMKEAPDA